MATSKRPQATIGAAFKLMKSGLLDDAARECRKVLKRERDPRAYRLLGKIAAAQGRIDDAISNHEKAIRLRPDDPDFRYGLAKVHAKQGEYEDALEQYDRALAHDSDHCGSLAGRAEALERLGRFDEARTMLDPVIEREAEDGEVAAMYARLLAREGDDTRAVEILERHTAPGSNSPQARRRVYYELGKSYGKLGDFEASFDAYRRANELEMQPFQIIDCVRAFDRIRNVFSRERMAARPTSTVRSKLPVFVVGMPRSGSTLVEQILDAHPDVHGAGEIEDFWTIVQGLAKERRSKREFPEVVDELDVTTLDRVAERHLAHLRKRDPSAERVVDKHLLNFQLIGMIATLHPEAKIIHTCRDPLSVCFSIFTLAMNPVSMPYSTDLRHLGQYHRQYERLMESWKQTLDIPILEVQYEDVVADQETQSRRIVEFCELPWDDACLGFHRTGRTVATASYDQVRKPIYKTALKRYEGYEPFLGPLREGLGMQD
ncbi:MAG: tetratricopeptide repeat-containing sulfotransferase family protein [Planctomycetota bacterium]|jgi:tetratricopeptide (TPR) repeat protein